jgi:hypothetical protein
MRSQHQRYQKSYGWIKRVEKSAGWPDNSSGLAGEGLKEALLMQLQAVNGHSLGIRSEGNRIAPAIQLDWYTR